MGVNRRRFIMLGAGLTGGILLSPLPWKVTDDISIWTQNWSWIPRIPKGPVELKPSISKLAGGGAPIRVATTLSGGRPVVAYGNAENPLSGGGIGALAAAEVQSLYRPARVKGPMKKTGDGSFEPVSWDEAASMLADKLKGSRGRVAMVSGDETGTANEVFSAFLKGLGSTDFYAMPSEHHLAARAWHGLMNGQGHPGLDLENADHVLILGPDLLDSWGTVERNAKAFSNARPMGKKAKATFVYAGPVENRTAVVSDTFVPCAPGAEATLALGIAYHLLQMGAGSMAGGFDDFRNLVRAEYTPAKVQQATGLSEAQVKGLARGLMQAGRPLVVAGSPIGQGGSAASFVAGMALNVLLGRVGATGGVKPIPEMPTVVPHADARSQVMGRDFVGYLLDLEKGKAAMPGVLMVYEANPRYALPGAEKTAAVLDKVPFTVSFSSYMDETAAKADLIMPNPIALERYDDMETPYGAGAGIYCAVQPVIAPVFDCKATTDVFLKMAGKFGVNLGFDSFEQVIEAKAKTVGADAGDLFDGSAAVNESTVFLTDLSLAPDFLAKAVKPGGGLLLAPQNMRNIGSAKTAVPPFNLLTIGDHELDADGMYASMNSETAASAGVSQGQAVTLSSSAGSVKVKVNIDETVMTGVVAAPLWLGHTDWDEFAQGKGDNLCKVLEVTSEPGSGLTVWNATKVQIA